MNGNGDRIAVIGNMNNGNFALTRYLRDLGADAHLFLYTNEFPHFLPHLDTTDWEKWKPFVHDLHVSNGGYDALFGRLDGVAKRLHGFDKFLGNGISPVLMKRLGRRLDVFVPYGEGVEFIAEFNPKWYRPQSVAGQLVRKLMMERALVSNVGSIVTANHFPRSTATYRRLGLETVFMPIISHYDAEALDDDALDDAALAAIDRMRAASIAVFSQTQHRWQTQLGGAYPPGGKKNDWLIRGFAEYLEKSQKRDGILVLLEYGPDVGLSKALVDELGIADRTVWLPMMSRFELMAVARHADIGADAFMGMLWGGTGWENLSLGKPILHHIANPEAYNSPTLPLPPYFDVDSPGAIAQVLLENDRESLARMGKTIRDWYERYQGPALARRYLTLLREGR